MDENWFEKWKCYVAMFASEIACHDDKVDHPGPVDNKALLNGKNLIVIVKLLIFSREIFATER